MQLEFDLVNRIKAGDEEAFEELFYEIVEQLVNFARHFLRSRADAENVVQEVFIKLWEKRDSLEAEQNLSAYLYVMVKNRALNELRKDGIVFSNELLDTQIDNVNPLPDEILNTTELEDQINLAIENLPEKCKLVFKLNRFEKKSYAEIANLLNISVKTVENHMHKALKVLRQQLHYYLTSILIK